MTNRTKLLTYYRSASSPWINLIPYKQKVVGPQRAGTPPFQHAGLSTVGDSPTDEEVNPSYSNSAPLCELEKTFSFFSWT